MKEIVKQERKLIIKNKEFCVFKFSEKLEFKKIFCFIFKGHQTKKSAMNVSTVFPEGYTTNQSEVTVAQGNIEDNESEGDARKTSAREFFYFPFY